ncbi:hypothetical protein STENM36S_02854 [Streptomyces tendae]
MNGEIMPSRDSAVRGETVPLEGGTVGGEAMSPSEGAVGGEATSPSEGAVGGQTGALEDRVMSGVIPRPGGASRSGGTTPLRDVAISGNAPSPRADTLFQDDAVSLGRGEPAEADAVMRTLSGDGGGTGRAEQARGRATVREDAVAGHDACDGGETVKADEVHGDEAHGDEALAGPDLTGGNDASAVGGLAAGARGVATQGDAGLEAGAGGGGAPGDRPADDELLGRVFLARVLKPGDEAVGRWVRERGVLEVVRRLREGGRALPGVSEKRWAGLCARAGRANPRRDLAVARSAGARFRGPRDRGVAGSARRPR